MVLATPSSCRPYLVSHRDAVAGVADGYVARHVLACGHFRQARAGVQTASRVVCDAGPRADPTTLIPPRCAYAQTPHSCRASPVLIPVKLRLSYLALRAVDTSPARFRRVLVGPSATATPLPLHIPSASCFAAGFAAYAP